jgi:protein O-mannosyl-transferase
MIKNFFTFFNQQKLIIYIVLIAATLAVYWQVNQFDFINMDDNIYVTENSDIKSGFTVDGMINALVSKHFNLWTPLVWLSFTFDYQIYSLNAGGYHVTNLILHILSTVLLFWLFNRMTGAVWKSAFVAAFFALHPLHVESVAWISERKDVLSAFSWMLTLCIYVYYTEKPVIGRYLLVLFSFILALMSKPMVVTLPLIMILLDYWPLARCPKTSESQITNWILWQLKEKTPFIILSTVLVFITLYNSSNQEIKHFPLCSRLLNMPVSFITYLEKTFWPHDMTIYYLFPENLPFEQTLAASLLILIVTITVIFMAKHLPYLFVGWLWFAITMAPVIGIIQIGSHATADRYSYLPSIGIGVMLAWGITSMVKKWPPYKNFLLLSALIFLVFISYLSWHQCRYWKNSICLFSHALQVKQDNYIAHNHLASALLKQGQLDKAIHHYNEAIRLNPFYYQAYYNRGTAYYIIGQKQLALEDFIKTIHIIPKSPKYVQAFNNLGVTYSDLGQYQLAIDNFNEAIMLIPEYANAYKNRSFVYFKLDNIKSGCQDAQKACELGSCKALDMARNKGLCK